VNTQWLEVNNWLDLIGNAWIGLVLIAVAAVPSWYARRNGQGIRKVQDQVVNGHKTPMREDLDSVKETLHRMGEHIREDMNFIKTELSDIRSDLRSERTERLNLDHRFEEHRKNEVQEGNSKENA